MCLYKILFTKILKYLGVCFIFTNFRFKANLSGTIELLW